MNVKMSKKEVNLILDWGRNFFNEEIESQEDVLLIKKLEKLETPREGEKEK